MVAWFAAREAAPDPIRPFNPARDMAELAGLVEVAFGEELALTESFVVQDMRQLALLGPMLRVTQSLLTLFGGYVWVDGGRVVGNVTLSPEREPLTWSISNVAVLPAYRGRGIARQLMERALQQVHREGGRRVLLQVRDDNPVALGLYRRLGFEVFDALCEYRLPPGRLPQWAAATRPGLRAVRAADGRRLYGLALASTPAVTLQRRPVHARDWRRGVGWALQRWLKSAFGAQDQLELAAEERGQLVAYGGISVSLGRGPHSYRLMALPEARGHWELALTESLLSQLAGAPERAVHCYLPAAYRQGGAALELAGFRLLRTLAQMSLEGVNLARVAQVHEGAR